MAGFYSGLIQGMTGLANIRHQQMLDLATQSRIEGEKEQRQLQKLEAAMSVQKYNQEIADRQTQSRLASLAFNQDQPERELDSVSSTTKSLADQFQTYGKSLLAQGQGKLGMDVLKEVDNMRRQATQDQLTSLQISAQKMEQAGEILSSVGTNEELQYALPQLAKLSVVPPRTLFQNGQIDVSNPQVQSWIAGKASESKTGLEKIKAGVLGLQLAEKVKAQQAAVQEEQQRTFETNAAERRSQVGAPAPKQEPSAVVSALGSAQAKGKGEGVYEKLYSKQVTNAANEMRVALQNLSDLTNGFETPATKGFLQDLGTKSLGAASISYLSNSAITNTQQQAYSSIIEPLIRIQAYIESGGRPAAATAMMEQLRKAFIVEAGQNHEMQLRKAGELRQLAMAGIESELSDEKYTKPELASRKAILERAFKDIPKSIPFTNSDIIRWKDGPGKGVSFKKFVQDLNYVKEHPESLDGFNKVYQFIPRELEED